jgi:hypothetical protein
MFFKGVTCPEGWFYKLCKQGIQLNNNCPELQNPIFKEIYGITVNITLFKTFKILKPSIPVLMFFIFTPSTSTLLLPPPLPTPPLPFPASTLHRNTPRQLYIQSPL